MDDRSRTAVEHLSAVLAALAGPGASPRPDQTGAVAALLRPGARVLVVQATGWGKSAVYWAAARALRAGGSGPALVVSPLLALMRDQVAAASRAGLSAVTLNSTNVDDWDDVFAALAADSVDVLLISPERLASASFAQRLPSLLERVGLVVIDEAHCVSDWGFDFRPDYQRLARLLLDAGGASVLATTATANLRVTEDVAAQLAAAGKNTAAAPTPQVETSQESAPQESASGAVSVFRGSLARTSLRLSVVTGLSPLERFAYVAEAVPAFHGSGIVYALTVAEAERLTRFLTDCGIDAVCYTGRSDPEVRLEVEQRLRANAVKVVVATSALGMGFDKPDLSFVIHVGSPASPVAYYQQVGRAGRALPDADAVLLPGPSDERIWDHFASASIPREDEAAAVLAALAAEPASVVGLEAATGVRRGRLETLLRVLSVYGAVVRDGSLWRATRTPYVHDRARWDALLAVRRAEADLMRSYAGAQGCLMRFLQLALDDPDPSECGRCSVCSGCLPSPGPAPSPDSVAAARRFLRGVDVPLPPRKLWPKGVSRSGRIVGAEEGRALAFADDPAWPKELAELFSPSPRLDGELADAAVAALGRWRGSWSARPVAVVPFGSAAAELLAAHVAAVGRLPLLDLFRPVEVQPPAGLASAAHVSFLEGSVSLKDPAMVPAGPVLLVAGQSRSGWGVTVAAALLREAGASAVLPLVAHQLP